MESTAGPPAIAAVPALERGTVSSDPHRGQSGSSGGSAADAQRAADLQRQREMWSRDMEVRADLASDSEKEIRIPPVFELEYGADGRTYAVEPVQQRQVKPAEVTAADATEPEDSDERRSVEPPVRADAPVAAATDEPATESIEDEPSPSPVRTVIDARPRAFVDPAAEIRPGTRLDEIV